METENRREGKQEQENSHTTAATKFLLKELGFWSYFSIWHFCIRHLWRASTGKGHSSVYKNSTDIFLIWIQINNI